MTQSRVGWLRPSLHFSRRISRVLRIDSLAPAISPPAIALVGSLSASGETVGTFTLDGLSFVSFGDERVLPLPPGSTIRFRFGAPAGDGSMPFTIQPVDVSIGEIPLPSGGVLRYEMASTASGRMRATNEGRTLSFSADVRATLDRGAEGGGSFEFAVPFTTETTAASNLSGTQTLDVSGMRLVDGVWYG